MHSHLLEDVSELGEAYWRHRVVTLERVVAELLVKNQSMRFTLQAIQQQKQQTEESEKSSQAFRPAPSLKSGLS